MTLVSVPCSARRNWSSREVVRCAGGDDRDQVAAGGRAVDVHVAAADGEQVRAAAGVEADAAGWAVHARGELDEDLIVAAEGVERQRIRQINRPANQRRDRELERIEIKDFDFGLVGVGDQVQRVVGVGEDWNDEDLGRDDIAAEAFVVVAGGGLDAEGGCAAEAGGGVNLKPFAASSNETKSPSTTGVTPSFKNSEPCVMLVILTCVTSLPSRMLRSTIRPLIDC